ncbi:MAG: B12-binding domain-containing radical SAM protein [Saccharofermentanales bacterium]
MKTILVAVNATYNHTNLAIRYLKHYYMKSGYANENMEIICKEFTINDDLKENTAFLLRENADVYGFSCYIWNIGIILEMTGILKKINPGCHVVLGGPEISYEEYGFFDMHPEIDFIVRDHGELAFTKLLNHLISLKNGSNDPNIYGSGDLKNYGSADSKFYGRMIEGEPVPLNGIGFPYENADFTIKQKQYYYETSRGCPYNCSYCLSSASKFADCLPVEKVKKDMSLFIDMKLKQVKLVDRTFNFDDGRAIEIWRFLIEKYMQAPFKTNFHFEITADLLSEEAIALLRTAPKGVFQFEIGIQSTNPIVLENVHRKVKTADIFANIRKLKEMDNISIHLDLIAGLPGDDWKTFAKSFNDVFSLKPSMLQLGFLKVLKGSPIRKEAPMHGILYEERPPYEVISTAAMSFFEILKLKNIENLVDRFYNSGQFKYSMDFLSGYADDAFAMFESLEDFWKSSGMPGRKIARQEMIQIFLTFGTKMIGHAGSPKHEYGSIDSQKAMFRDALKFDYYRFDKKTDLEILNINRSNHHPDLPRDKEKKSWFTDGGRPAAIKPRLEHYTFDVAKLIETKRFVAVSSFVLYEMNGDKPKIIDILNVC